MLSSHHPLPRRLFISFVSTQRCLRTSAPRPEAQQEAPQQPKKKTSKLVYISGVGLTLTGLYYLLVNGPSQSAPTSKTAPLSPTHFTPVTVTASVQCTPYTKLLTFTIPKHLIPAQDALQPIYSIYVKDSDIQVERPYTPLEGIDSEGQMHFWVKRYQGGEVGRWLHERKVGEEIEIRGPVQNVVWGDGEWDEIIMISGGTGITPFYQLIHSVFARRGDDVDTLQTRLTLLHSSPRRADLPPPQLLDTLRDYARRFPESFQLALYVDTLDANAKGEGEVAAGRIGRKAVEEALGTKKETGWWAARKTVDLREKRRLFLVCGPEPMVAAIAGPRGRNLTQGRVGGVLGELGAGEAQRVTFPAGFISASLLSFLHPLPAPALSRIPVPDREQAHFLGFPIQVGTRLRQQLERSSTTLTSSTSQKKVSATHAFTERLLPDTLLYDQRYDPVPHKPPPSLFSEASMPVPVSVPTRCPSHTVSNKQQPIHKQSALQHLLSSLPEPPTGPPPAFTNRETWIQSLPPSRRYKVRQEGDSLDPDQMRADVVHAPLSNGKPWPPSPPGAIKKAIAFHERRRSAVDTRPDVETEEWTEDEEFFAGPGFTRPPPITRRVSSDDAIRPAGHLAMPFSDNVSRPYMYPPPPPYSQVYPPPVSSPAREPRKAPSPIPTVVTPSDMMLYRKLVADPLADWVAAYIWQVCTHGMSLPPEFVVHEDGYGALARTYAAEPPQPLADSIRTLLCATLLQPSAIFLALWYIARFPVFFGTFAFDPKTQRKEFMFRLELLGEGSQEPGAERTKQLLEVHAPFRLFLLGVMLSNKWLDDNTFSNKTWHQVSGVPMRALNKLETLALDLLSHDLSLPPQAWSQWLEHLRNYHRSLAPFPEPIGPPKETPHLIIRRTLEDLVEAGQPPLTTGVIPEPIFLGLAEHKRERERVAKEQLDILEVDLDEDGPLREQYLPKQHQAARRMERRSMEQQVQMGAKELPPPAAWSPAADPPIITSRARPIYQAVRGPHQQPQSAPVVEVTHYLPSKPSFHNIEGAPGIKSPFQRQVPTHTHSESQPWGIQVTPQQQTQRTMLPRYAPQYVPSSLMNGVSPAAPHGVFNRPHQINAYTMESFAPPGLPPPVDWLRT